MFCSCGVMVGNVGPMGLPQPPSKKNSMAILLFASVNWLVHKMSHLYDVYYVKKAKILQGKDLAMKRILASFLYK